MKATKSIWKLGYRMNNSSIFSFAPLSREAMKEMHSATLKVLDSTGLRIDCTDFLAPLDAAGARVDKSSRIVTFPEKLIEDTIEYFRTQIASGRRQYLLNGVTNARWTPPSGCKFGGACIEYFDYSRQEVRKPTEQDLIDLLQLGEALDRVGFVGNPVACLADIEGKPIPAGMQRIKTASVVAKYTTKCGSTEVWSTDELDLQVEIGEIVRGSSEEYVRTPCFVTARETIAPLQFPKEDGEILLELARRGLPCTVVAMPLTGATSPCSVAGNVVMANAEILGVMAAIHVLIPDAMIAGGVITGIMDMSAATTSFSAPEALLQDAAIAALYDDYYGQDLAIGTGYTDAKYPGVQSLAEKMQKMTAAAAQSRYNYPVGLLAGGKRFSAEQAVLDLEIAASIEAFNRGVPVDAETLAVEVINEVGIGNDFLSHPHTGEHFRSAMWYPEYTDRSHPTSLAEDKSRDMLETVAEKIRQIRDRTDLYKIDAEKERAIDDVVKHAEKLFLNS